jgi:outer membrane protein assembly factor BamB
MPLFGRKLTIRSVVMRKSLVFALCLTLSLIAWQALHIGSVHADSSANWLQWGRNPQHNGASSAIGVIPGTQLADITYDPFVAQMQAESGGELLAHYQVPLIDGDMVFLEYKTGVYTSCNPVGSGQPYPCGPDAWNGEIWNERAYSWQNGSLVETWNYQSDWKPEPNSNAGGRNEKTFGLSGWEPVFHAAVGNGFVYVPGASGSIHKVRETDGTVIADFLPFGTYTNVFVSSPLTLDAAGNLYYNVLALDNEFPWTAEPRGSWLVKISPQGFITKATYASLVPDQIQMCVGGLTPCGLQRAALNVAPVLSPDGQTIYTVSRAQFFSWSAYLIAASTKDLSAKWDTYLFGKVRPGEAAYVFDLASSSPTVAPDGSILFGTLSSVDGFMMKFSPEGKYLAAFNFGWDSTPAIYAHDGTYSVILKDNLYGNSGPYFIAQLNADMVEEWSFRNDSIDVDHPHGYEWCVNAPAVDANGTVYANSEDGNVYVIDQTGKLKGKMFLRTSIEAAYTPVALGPDGKIYTENDGDVFVLGP